MYFTFTPSILKHSFLNYLLCLLVLTASYYVQYHEIFRSPCGAPSSVKDELQLAWLGDTLFILQDVKHCRRFLYCNLSSNSLSMRYTTYNKTVDGGIVGGICYSAVMNERLGEVVSGQWRQRTRGCSRLGISHNWPPYPSALCRPSTHLETFTINYIHMMNIYIRCDREA